MANYEEVFSGGAALLNAIKKADALTRRKHGEHATLERALFLSWWCDKGDCKFCYMSTQKQRISEPRAAKRSYASLIAEAKLCERIGWNIEFLSGGYGSYGEAELRQAAEMIAHVTHRGVWLNVGVLKDLRSFGEEVEGIVGSIETANKKLHHFVCPSKPTKPIIKMLREAKELGLKTGVNIILGLGESERDLPALFELIEGLEIDRITYYSLNPHGETVFRGTPPPASLYQAGVIALTRLRFPEIKIIAGTWVDQLPNIGVALLAGANGITKFPLFNIFGTRHARKVEEEVRFAGRKLLGTFTDVSILKGENELVRSRSPGFVFSCKEPEVREDAIKRADLLKEKVEATMKSYIAMVERHIRSEADSPHLSETFLRSF